MNMTDIFAEIFEESIKSVHEFDEKLKVIKSLIEKETSKQNAKKLNAYFRGDKQNSNVQCKLFRCGKLSDEAKLFDEWKNDWQESGEKLSNDEFENLIRMQHEEKTFTRLLDFSTDPKVALRFACGRKGKSESAKVTMFFTNDEVLRPFGTEGKNQEKCIKIRKAFLELIRSENDISTIPDQYKMYYRKDYFIEPPQNFERIKRQKGIFLLMGNYKDGDSNYDQKIPTYNEKMIHELTSTGRGKIYDGFVGVLNISEDCVEEIRRELEQDKNYQIEYLMAESKPETETCLYETNTRR